MDFILLYQYDIPISLEQQIINTKFVLVNVVAIFLHPLAGQIQFVSILELAGTFHRWRLV